MTIFDIAAALTVLAATFGLLNHHVIRLPHTIGLVVISLVTSIVILMLNAGWPELGIAPAVQGVLERIDFHEALMNGMLSFLLFAGALHVDLRTMREQVWAIGILATLGVILSTVMVGVAIWWLLNAMGLPIPLGYAMVFGALISPTDPVAVLGILKTVKIPRSLEIKIAGESLFNDGVGVVVFLVVLALAAGGHGGDGVDAGEVAILFAKEALGGSVLGLVAGYISYRALASLDEFALEVLITLALVMGTYGLAHHIHVSGPIAIVVAGLLIGNQGMSRAMSDKTRDHVQKFWVLLDEILNSILFLMIGFEVLVVGFNQSTLMAGAITIPIVLAARYISVGLPLTALRMLGERFTRGAIPVLTWGGLRGGISVALALSLPPSEVKPVILSITYVVVVFSIIAQGLTMKPLVARVVKTDEGSGKG